MADKKYLESVKQVENTYTNKKLSSAMLSPCHTQIDKIEKEVTKERAVNPMAIRPPGVHVTLTEEKPSVNIIKKLFGF
jgi:hypothetical protein